MWFNLPYASVEKTDEVVENVNQNWFAINNPKNTEESFIKFL